MYLGKKKTKTYNEKDIAKELNCYYEKLYNIKNSATKEDIEEYMSELIEEKEMEYSKIRRQDIKNAIRESPSNKTPQLDSLTFEFYKKYERSLSTILLMLFSKSMKKGKLPKCFYRNYLSLIQKKGDKADT